MDFWLLNQNCEGVSLCIKSCCINLKQSGLMAFSYSSITVLWQLICHYNILCMHGLIIHLKLLCHFCFTITHSACQANQTFFHYSTFSQSTPDITVIVKTWQCTEATFRNLSVTTENTLHTAKNTMWLSWD